MGNTTKMKLWLLNQKNDIYASFKNYNKKSGEIANGNKKYILRKHANRYSYKGQTSEFSIIKPSEYKCKKIEDKLDYETFKRMMNKKKLKIEYI